ncbi:MAG: M14 family zinc carboxypeptidase [Agriterribacter sp.]
MRKIKMAGSVVLLLISLHTALMAQNDYYFPGTGNFDNKIPTPESFLGYPVGSHYTRHDEIVSYFKALATLSDRVHFQIIGKTYEERPQVILTITSAENYSKIEQIRQEHLTTTDPAKPVLPNTAPVVVLLGYSVHGAETSSGEAALLTAYYFAANQSEETNRFLKESVILIDPSLNPDGRDRAASWHNGFKSFPPVTDPADLEHNQAWPGGRTNHFFTDLNRDWLSAEQIESKNRLEFFHQWYPNVQIDFHEMGTNATYYFEPTPKGNESPLLPQASYDFNLTLARYHVAALDKIGSLYFTKEAFDNLAPVYGSTYPDYFGAVGVTFEQASSRGLAQESPSGIVTFPFTIRNHVTTGIATVRGAVAEKAGLFKLQKEFFASALQKAKLNTAKAYIFGDGKDVSLTNKLLGLALRHHLKVYEVPNDITVNGKRFEKNASYIVPAEQPFFFIAHSIFDEITAFKDTTTFYSTTAWGIAQAYNVQYAKITTPGFALGTQVTAVKERTGEIVGGKSSYAYLLDWTEYNAPRALYYLLSKGVIVKTALKPFTSSTTAGQKDFGYGTLVIPVALQTIGADSLLNVVKTAASISSLNFFAVSTGFSIKGIDLGSNNISVIKKPEVAILAGQGTSADEVGEVWFLLNKHLNIPVTKLDLSTLDRADISRYTTLILTSSGFGRGVEKLQEDKLKEWVNNGGTLVTFGSSSAWAIQKGLVKEKVFIDSSEFKQQGEVKREDFIKSREESRGGSGFLSADIDTTNPIAYGLRSRKIFFNKVGGVILQPSKNKYATVAQYDANPLVSGFISASILKNIGKTAVILLGQSGRGVVVLFATDPVYRHHWHGTDRLLSNAIFLGDKLRLQSFFSGELQSEE